MMNDSQPPVRLDPIVTRFDEEGVVGKGPALAVELGRAPGIGPERPSAARRERKVMTLMSGMVAGADSIDDRDLLRAGSTGRCWAIR